MAIPLLIAGLFFILTTFIAYFYSIGSEHRVLGINLHRVLEILDLREENTLATWFSSILFLMVSFGFVLLGWGQAHTFSISLLTRRVFQISAIGACYLSADEMASIHETIGHWLARIVNSGVGVSIDTHGFSWVLPFAPIGMFMLFWLAYLLYRHIIQLSDSKQRNYAKVALFCALLFLPSVFFLEALQAYIAYVQVSSNIFPCFEEMFEVLGMYSLFFTTTTIATYHRL